MGLRTPYATKERDLIALDTGIFEKGLGRWSAQCATKSIYMQHSQLRSLGMDSVNVVGLQGKFLSKFYLSLLMTGALLVSFQLYSLQPSEWILSDFHRNDNLVQLQNPDFLFHGNTRPHRVKEIKSKVILLSHLRFPLPLDRRPSSDNISKGWTNFCSFLLEIKSSTPIVNFTAY